RSDPLPWSVRVDVDVDLVRDLDAGLVTSQTQLVAEQEQQNEHHNDQQNDGKHAAASAATSFNDGRPLALGIVAIIGHFETLPCFPCLMGETNESMQLRFRTREAL